MDDPYQAAELTWVFRPEPTRPAPIRALAGRLVHGIGQVDPDGETDIVLRDGTHLRATRAEVVAE